MKEDSVEVKDHMMAIWKGALILILPLIAISFFLFLTFYLSRTQASTSLTFSTEKRIIDQQLNDVDAYIDSVSTDLIFLTSNKHLKSIASNTPTENENYLSSTQQEFYQFSSAKKIYDQIRFLDTSGMESIRINFNSGHPSIVSTDKLQNKKGRYYFDETFALNKGEIFISPLDLNIEHGQVEQPRKPMIRFGMPLFDLQGTKSGIVLLNYFGSYLLDRFKKLGESSPGSSLLLNRLGYYLVGESSVAEWGFMFTDDTSKEKTLAIDYPEAWIKIASSERGQFETGDGLFSYATAYPLNVGMQSSTGTGKAVGESESLLNNDEYYWKLVSFVPKEILYAEHAELKLILGSFMSCLFILITWGSWKLSSSHYWQKQSEAKLKQKTQALLDANQQLEILATTDSLTGLANRRYAMQALEQLWNEFSPQSKQVACLLIDADKFKAVNDNFGHDAGDTVLRQLAYHLKFSVRTDDIVCRLGGDEFLIICPNTDVEGLMVIAEKMHDHIGNLTIQIAGGIWAGSISVGAAIRTASMENPEELIKAADNGVYAAKGAGKNCIKMT